MTAHDTAPVAEPRINTEYLKLLREVFYFFKLSLWRKRPAQKAGSVLLVEPCLIGEFAASIPAIHDFIAQHPDASVDLMVTPACRPLAERVRGVRRVYTVRSVYGREQAHRADAATELDSYEKTIVLRVSKESYELLGELQTGVLITGLRQLLRYTRHLLWSVACGSVPRRWGDINFEMLGGTPRSFSFDEMFQFSAEEVERAACLPCMALPGKKILIHVGTKWTMKRWSRDKWVELLRMIHTKHGEYQFIFVGGPEDKNDQEYIASHLKFDTCSLVGQIDLAQLLLVIRMSDYLIGVDSGPRNIAHVADTRSVTILGPGPHMYMPPDRRDIALDKTRGRGVAQMFVASSTPFIERITPQEVYEAFLQLVASEE